MSGHLPVQGFESWTSAVRVAVTLAVRHQVKYEVKRTAYTPGFRNGHFWLVRPKVWRPE